MLNCTSCHELISAREDGALTAAQAAALAEHVAGCPSCAAELQRSSLIAATLRDLPQSQAPAALRAAVRRSLAAEPATERQPLWESWSSAWSRKRPALAWGGSLVAAACLMLLLTRPPEFDVTHKANPAGEEAGAPTSPESAPERNGAAGKAFPKSPAPGPVTATTKNGGSAAVSDALKAGASPASPPTAPSPGSAATGAKRAPLSPTPPVFSVPENGSSGRFFVDNKTAAAQSPAGPIQHAGPPSAKPQSHAVPMAPGVAMAPGAPSPRLESPSLATPRFVAPSQQSIRDQAGISEFRGGEVGGLRADKNFKKADRRLDATEQDGANGAWLASPTRAMPANSGAGAPRASTGEPAPGVFTAPAARPQLSPSFAPNSAAGGGRNAAEAVINGLSAANSEKSADQHPFGDLAGGNTGTGAATASHGAMTAREAHSLRNSASTPVPAPAVEPALGSAQNAAPFVAQAPASRVPSLKDENPAGGNTRQATDAADSNNVPAAVRPFSFRARVMSSGQGSRTGTSGQAVLAGEGYHIQLVLTALENSGASVIRLGGLGRGALRLEGGAPAETDGGTAGSDVAWRGEVRSGQKITLNLRVKSGGPQSLTISWEQNVGANQSKMVVVRTVPLPNPRTAAPAPTTP